MDLALGVVGVFDQPAKNYYVAVGGDVRVWRREIGRSARRHGEILGQRADVCRTILTEKWSAILDNLGTNTFYRLFCAGREGLSR